MMQGTTVCVYDDAYSVWTSVWVREVLRNSNIPVEVTDVDRLLYPRVMREVLEDRGTPTLPLLLSVGEERVIRDRYFSVLDKRGLTV